jgi:hypothetical protein
MPDKPVAERLQIKASAGWLWWAHLLPSTTRSESRSAAAICLKRM